MNSPDHAAPTAPAPRGRHLAPKVLIAICLLFFAAQQASRAQVSPEEPGTGDARQERPGLVSTETEILEGADVREIVRDVLDNKLAPILNKLNDIPGTVIGQLGFRSQDAELLRGGDLSAMLTEGFDQLRSLIENQKDLTQLATTFESSGACSDYRVNLGLLLQFADSMSTSVPALSDSPFELPVEPGDLGALIGAIPCAFVFPLSVVLPLDGLANWLVELATAQQSASDLLTGMAATPGTRVTSPFAECESVHASRVGLKQRMALLAGAGITFEVVGAMVNPDPVTAKRATRPDLPKFGVLHIGIHGYGKTSITRPKNAQWAIAQVLQILSRTMATWSNAGFARVRHCELVVGQDVIHRRFDDVDETLGDIETAISGIEGTSPELLDLLEVRLLNAVDTTGDAIIDRSDRHAETFDRWTDLALRMEIEDRLSLYPSRPIGTLIRPEFAGGLLETVREIVEVTIVESRNLGTEVDTAQAWFDRGEEHFAGAEYARAYLAYANAYRATLPRVRRFGWFGQDDGRSPAESTNWSVSVEPLPGEPN